MDKELIRDNLYQILEHLTQSHIYKNRELTGEDFDNMINLTIRSIEEIEGND